MTKCIKPIITLIPHPKAIRGGMQRKIQLRVIRCPLGGRPDTSQLPQVHESHPHEPQTERRPQTNLLAFSFHNHPSVMFQRSLSAQSATHIRATQNMPKRLCNATGTAETWTVQGENRTLTAVLPWENWKRTLLDSVTTTLWCDSKASFAFLVSNTERKMSLRQREICPWTAGREKVRRLWRGFHLECAELEELHAGRGGRTLHGTRGVDGAATFWMVGISLWNVFSSFSHF